MKKNLFLLLTMFCFLPVLAIPKNKKTRQLKPTVIVERMEQCYLTQANRKVNLEPLKLIPSVFRSLGYYTYFTKSRKAYQERLNDKLLMAARKQNLTKVKALLAKGASPNRKNYSYKPLTEAVQHSEPCIELVQTLLDHKADVNDTDHLGNFSALSQAIRYNKDTQVAQLLVKANANVFNCSGPYSFYYPEPTKSCLTLAQEIEDNDNRQAFVDLIKNSPQYIAFISLKYFLS